MSIPEIEIEYFEGNIQYSNKPKVLIPAKPGYRILIHGQGFFEYVRDFKKGQRLTSMREVYEAALAGHKIKVRDEPGYCYFDEDDGILTTYDDPGDALHMSSVLVTFSYHEYWEILE